MISLAHLTLLRCSTAELVVVADDAGFDAVGLRLMEPPIPGGRPAHAVDDRELIERTAQALDDTGLAVLDVEAIWVDADTQASEYERLFDGAARLGARNAVAMVHDTDLERAAATFGELCRLARPYGVSINLEFAQYSTVTSIDEAAALLDQVGAPNAAILIDTLHFVRSGGTAEEIRPHSSRLARYIQIADAQLDPPPDVSLYREEARFHRLDPGLGALPLQDILGALPAHLTLSVEVPNQSLNHLTPAERARQALEETRRLLGGRWPHQTPSAL